jgi:hypothetical protein
MPLRLLSERVDAAIDFVCGVLRFAATRASTGKVGVDLGILGIAPGVVILVIADGLIGAAEFVVSPLQVGRSVALSVRFVGLFDESSGSCQLLGRNRALRSATRADSAGD